MKKLKAFIGLKLIRICIWIYDINIEEHWDNEDRYNIKKLWEYHDKFEAELKCE